FRHNYNKASREAMYEFFGKWLLHENDPAKFKEKPYVMDRDGELLAFMHERTKDRISTFKELPATAYHRLPGQLDENSLKADLIRQYNAQLKTNWPTDL